MSEQDNGQVATLQCPTTDDREDWKAHWKKQGQSWRTEPEIDMQRQEYLDERCGVIADIKQGIYPFKDVELSRADIEWLLAIFLNESGTVDWEEKYGLDLRGALLYKVDLRGLPLRGMRCGLTEEEWADLNEEAHRILTEEEKALFTEEDKINDEALPTVVRERLFKLLEEAGANLEKADLRGVNLEMAHFAGTKMKRAWLDRANLTKADLSYADLQWAHFTEANLEEAELSGTNLEGTYLRLAYLKGASFYRAYMKKAVLEGAVLYAANMENTHLEEARLSYAILEQASFIGAHLGNARLEEVRACRANFTATCLNQVFMNRADLSGANLSCSHLEGASICNAHMEQANLSKAYLGGGYNCSTSSSSGNKLETNENVVSSVLQPSDLSGVFFDGTTIITDVLLGDKKFGFPSLADIHWNDLNVAIVDWSKVRMLGDERQARQKKKKQYELESSLLHTNITDLQLEAYRKAVRANRQLAVVLQAQGLNEDAAYFTYRAQKLQQVVLRRQRRVGRYLFSLFLDLLAGYGYKLGRSFITYAVVISLFALIYFLLGPHLAWNEAIVISMTAFHGRGFFPDQFKPGDPQALVAAIEAFVGLLIEVTLIATLTQRLFGK